jgi:hypothetical protein
MVCTSFAIDFLGTPGGLSIIFYVLPIWFFILTWALQLSCWLGIFISPCTWGFKYSSSLSFVIGLGYGWFSVSPDSTSAWFLKGLFGKVESCHNINVPNTKLGFFVCLLNFLLNLSQIASLLEEGSYHRHTSPCVPSPNIFPSIPGNKNQFNLTICNYCIYSQYLNQICIFSK